MLEFFKIIKGLIRDLILSFRFLAKMPTISEYMANGIYTFRNEHIKKSWLIFPIVIVFSKNKSKKAFEKSCYVYFGAQKKIVAISGNYVVSFYHTNDCISVFNRMQKLLPLINYPISEYLCFNYRKKYNVCEKVNGDDLYMEDEVVSYFIKEISKHNRCAKKILNYKYAKEILDKFEFYQIKDIISYIQHGDLCHMNIISLGVGKEYKFIDLETINYYPCFFDIIRYILLMNDGLKLYCDGYFDNDLSKIIEDEKISLAPCVKDKYLAAFIICNVKASIKSIDINALPKEYVITKSVLCDYKKG